MALSCAAPDVLSALDRRGAVRYLLGRATPEGGYSFYRTPEWGVEEPNAPDTLAALRSLQLLGVDPPDPTGTADFLRSLQDEAGGYPSLPIGCAALLGLEALGADPTRSPVEWMWRQIDVSLRRRRARDWSGALTRLSSAVALLDVTGAELDTPRRWALMQDVDEAKDPGGGWARPGADLATTAVALRLTSWLGLDLDELVRIGVTELFTRSEDPALGLCLGPHGKTATAGVLWGGLEIRRQLGLPLTYPTAVATSLVMLQRPDGGFGPRHRAISTLHDTWLALKAAHLLEDHQEDQS